VHRFSFRSWSRALQVVRRGLFPLDQTQVGSIVTGPGWVAAVFWGAALVVLYTYVGYPILISAVARVRRRPVNRSDSPEVDPPEVLVLLVVHDHARRIARRVENMLASDYPGGRLEVLVALDDCGSETDAEVRSLCGDRVRVLDFPSRTGKARIINEVLQTVEHEIVVFCDVRQSFDRDAIRHLVSNFTDPTVGAVSGELHLTGGGDSAAGLGMRLYWAYEKTIRKAESRVYSMVGATGAIYALRRRLFHPIPEDTILDDVVIPMQAVARGYRIVFDGHAKARDGLVSNSAGEYRRRVRNLTGNIQSFVLLRRLLNPLTSPVMAQFFSHKVLRLVVPYCLAAMFIASVALADQPIYRALLVAQMIWYGVAAIGYVMPARLGRARLLLQLPTFVAVLNLAAIGAAFNYLRNGPSGIWDPEPSGNDRWSH